METTKNEMPSYAKVFFHKLSKYLDNKFYFYGSVQRNDYFPNSSDIDADLFTDTEQSTILKLQNFLGVKKYQFRRFVYKLHKTNKIVRGHKIKYIDLDNNFTTEISVYNEKDKNDVLVEHNSKSVLPFYVSFFLIILKTIYYKLRLISERTYTYFKKILMNYMIEGEDVEFVGIDILEPAHYKNNI
jgi:hypothetical protein